MTTLLIVSMLGGLVAAWCPYYWVFGLGKFLEGLTQNGIYVSGYIIGRQNTYARLSNY